MTDVCIWQHGSTALTIAAENGSERIVRALITAGANVNAKDQVITLLVIDLTQDPVPY